MGRSRYKVIENVQPHFITCTVMNWLPLFGEREVVEVVIDSMRFLQKENRMKIFGYVIMENHLHLISAGKELAKEIGHFKSYTARKIIDYLQEKKAQGILERLNYFKLRHKTDRNYQFWQEGSHPQLIQGEKMMMQKLEYIHYNPVKKGYVDDPVHWCYSSARQYAGEDGLLEICIEW